MHETLERKESGTVQASASVSHELYAVDYAELNRAGHSIWSSFFSLASMTFSWNASLGAAFAVLIFNGSKFDDPFEKFIYIPSYTVLLLIVSVLGVFYNIGAKIAYRHMNQMFFDIYSKLKSNDAFREMMVTKALGELLDRRVMKSRWVGDWTHTFFSTLVVAWIFLFLSSVFLMFQ